MNNPGTTQLFSAHSGPRSTAFKKQGGIMTKSKGISLRRCHPYTSSITTGYLKYCLWVPSWEDQSQPPCGRSGHTLTSTGPGTQSPEKKSLQGRAHDEGPKMEVYISALLQHLARHTEPPHNLISIYLSVSSPACSQSSP